MIRATVTQALLFFLSSLALGDPQASSGGYRVEIHIAAGARAWPETNRWSAEVFTPEGTALYQIDRVVPFDVPYPTLTVARDGSAVLLDAARGRVEFLTTLGDVVAVWSPFASAVPSYERIIKCSIGNRTAAFLLSEPGGMEVRVVTTDLNGRVLRETVLPGSSAGEIVSAADDSSVLVSATIDGERVRHVTRLLGQDGTTLVEAPMLFRVGDIGASTGRYAFADRYVVIGGSLADRQPAYRVELSGGDRIVTGLRAGAGGVLVVTEQIAEEGGTPLYRDPEVVILRDDGAVLERSQLQSTSARPAALVIEGDEIVVRAGTKTARFRGVL